MEQVQYIKKLNPKGYVLINIDGDWVLEHKYNTEMFIGRVLNKSEVVHHIDGDKENNRISNLMLFKSQKDHQKFHNKIRQFGYTNPIKRQIAFRWKEYLE